MSIQPIRAAHSLFILILLLPGIATALVAGDESWSSGFSSAKTHARIEVDGIVKRLSRLNELSVGYHFDQRCAVVIGSLFQRGS